MVDMALFQGAITGLKAAADIAIGLSNIRTLAEVQGKAIDLQQIILSAQSSALAAQAEQFALVVRIRELEKEVTDVKAWNETKQRYVLQEPNPGTFVYALKAQSGSTEPSHWICAACYENAKRSILQLKTRGDPHDQYQCPSCKTEVKAKGTRSDLGMT